MAKNETVTLKIKPGATSGGGWQNTVASNGQTYSFKYTGGENDNGGLKTKVGDGAASIALSVDTDNRYAINNVTFTADAYNQLTWRPTAGSNASGAILDANTEAENADYAVLVIDAQANGATIPCDPMIQNEPRGPTTQGRIQHTLY